MSLRTPCLMIILALLQVWSSGVFELKIHSFHTAQRICRRHRDCHIFFRICLKHPEDVISAEPPCTFGTGHTNVIRADHTSISSSAPIRVPFHFKWPVNLKITNKKPYPWVCSCQIHPSPLTNISFLNYILISVNDSLYHTANFDYDITLYVPNQNNYYRPAAGGYLLIETPLCFLKIIWSDNWKLLWIIGCQLHFIAKKVGY